MNRLRRDFLSGGQGVLSHEDFVRAVRRERVRSDRADRPFAVIVIALRSLPEDHLVRIPELARELVRETDDVGWFAEDRVGVLLPEADRAQAEVVAAKLREGIGGEAGRHAVRVFVHGDWCESPETCAEAARARGSRSCHPSAGHCEPTSDSDGLPILGEGDDEAPEVLDDLLVTPLPEWKRAMDIVGAGTLLTMLFPVLVGVALAVRASSPGPVIFRQKRAGLAGRPFWFYKFRTMYQDAEARKAELLEQNEMTGPVFKMTNDPRVTPIGKILRRTSLDELPQLVNVLLGDMTLVGPRPPTLDEVPHYRRWHRRRLAVTGGITCVWQVSGRCTIAFEDWMRMDARYIQRRSLATDVGLLLKTVGAVVSGKGAR